MKTMICPETNEECEYKPADDEPCHQCRIFRTINKEKKLRPEQEFFFKKIAEYNEKNDMRGRMVRYDENHVMEIYYHKGRWEYNFYELED